MRILRRWPGVAMMLLAACASSRFSETEDRIARVNAVYRVNEPVPIQGVSRVDPWQQVEPACQARQQKRGAEAAQVVDAELSQIRGSGPGARAARERVETEGRLQIAEAMLAEWRACLLEHGWRLAPRKTNRGTP